MKIVFAGSPAYALPSLEALAKECEVVGVITQPDRPVGRKRTLTPTPVKQYALARGIPVLDFARLRDHADQVRALGGDIMITCAYGQLLIDSGRAVEGVRVKQYYQVYQELMPEEPQP